MVDLSGGQPKGANNSNNRGNNENNSLKANQNKQGQNNEEQMLPTFKGRTTLTS